MARNLRRHWARDVVRVGVLLASDILTTFAVVGLLDLLAILFGPAGAVSQTVHRWLPFAGALVLSVMMVGGYGQGTRRKDASRVLRAAALTSLILLYPVLFTTPGSFVLQFVLLAALTTVALVCSRRLLDVIVRYVRPVVGARTIVLRAAGSVLPGAGGLEGEGQRLNVVATITIDSTSAGPSTRPIMELTDRVAETGADTVLLWGTFSEQQFSAAVDVAIASGCRLVAGPSPRERAHIEAHPLEFGGIHAVELTRPHLTAWQHGVKRAMDVIIAVPVLLFLSPLLLVVSLAVKLGSPGPVLFGHRRLGVHGRPFNCYKFRSMRVDAEQVLRSDAALYASYVTNHFKLPERQDPRLTAVGRFLRRTSLDELPQLLNVLRGDMSIVGPRPIVPEELDHYAEGDGLLFLSLRPGVTGLWATSGRSAVGYPVRAQLELDYVRGWSILGDVSIMLRTFPAVLRGRGAH